MRSLTSAGRSRCRKWPAPGTSSNRLGGVRRSSARRAIDGSWQPRDEIELPAGTLLVPATQRFARIAATLLEPQSEDSLSTWNFFEATTAEQFPVLRIPRE